MIVLADNDVLLKLAQCDLFEEFLTAFQVTAAEVAITRRTRFSIKVPRHRKKLGQENFGRLEAFLEKISDVHDEPTPSAIAFLTDQIGIDAGEAVLFAICTQRENCIIATGDKQCLLGLREAATTDQDCEAICQTLSGKIFCFEQIIHRILGHFGFETVREKLIRGRECDAGLRLWLGSTLDANEDRFREGLTSHLDDLRRNTGNLLAP